MTKLQLNNQTQKFLTTYNLFEDDLIQQIQLQHRLSLVEAFDLPRGGRVLEIGCGQGDTTMAIAHAVGENGEVIAIDIASRDYGAPLTLGEATDIVMQSALGKQITFHFETDFEKTEFNSIFDVAVLSHCSWYFKETSELLSIFKKLKTITKRICFAEWDINFSEMSQRPHFCAVTILALYSQFIENENNVQNLFNRFQIQQLLEQAGFSIDNQTVVDASYLPDAKWEKSYANSVRAELTKVALRMEPLLNSYYDLMNQTKEEDQSLNSFIISAKPFT